MISFLIGIIEEKKENLLYLNVNGMGFEIIVSTNTLAALPMTNTTIKLLTYMNVREDDISLYGFSSQEEKDLFSKLITVSGIGPKLAISILSGLSCADLTIAIVHEDSKLLSKIKGLGKKTAERLCLELKDKLQIVGLNQSENNFTADYDEDAVQQATDTLIALGINKNEAYMLARSHASTDATAEEIIAKSLRGYKG